MAAVVVLIYLMGLSIPSQQIATVEINIHAPVDRVWQIITSWEEQPKWRTTVSKVKVNSPQSFVEYPTHGDPITFHVISAVPSQKLELKMSGAVLGGYVAKLTTKADVTVFSANEFVTIENPFLRTVNKVFFNLDSFAQQYAQELKQYAESTP